VKRLLCPNCQVPIPGRYARKLLASPVGEDVLLLCSRCGSVSILHGAELVQITREFVAGLSPEKTKELVEAILNMRGRSAGVEATIEMLERAAGKTDEDRT